MTKYNEFPKFQATAHKTSKYLKGLLFKSHSVDDSQFITLVGSLS